MKRSTSARRYSACFESSDEALWICCAAAPVSLAALPTTTMLADTSLVPAEAYDVARNLAGGGRLFVDGGRDGGGNVVDFADDVGNGGNGRHGFLGSGLHRRDLDGDFLGGLGGLVSQPLDLGGDDGEAFARVASPRRFDGGVECQQIGLGGDVVDEADDLADLVGVSNTQRHR